MGTLSALHSHSSNVEASGCSLTICQIENDDLWQCSSRTLPETSRLTEMFSSPLRTLGIQFVRSPYLSTSKSVRLWFPGGSDFSNSQPTARYWFAFALSGCCCNS